MQPPRGLHHGAEKALSSATRTRRSRTAAVLAASLALALAAPTAAVAGPSAAPQKPSGERTFRSSFEADEKQPDWRNTVEEGPDGTERSSGVDGGFSAGIPGNVTDRVTDVRASAENTAGGEVKENLVDVEPASSGWRSRRPAGSSSTWTSR